MDVSQLQRKPEFELLNIRFRQISSLALHHTLTFRSVGSHFKQRKVFQCLRFMRFGKLGASPVRPAIRASVFGRQLGIHHFRPATICTKHGKRQESAGFLVAAMQTFHGNQADPRLVMPGQSSTTVCAMAVTAAKTCPLGIGWRRCGRVAARSPASVGAELRGRPQPPGRRPRRPRARRKSTPGIPKPRTAAAPRTAEGGPRRAL